MHCVGGLLNKLPAKALPGPPTHFKLDLQCPLPCQSGAPHCPANSLQSQTTLPAPLPHQPLSRTEIASQDKLDGGYCDMNK